MGSWKSRKIMRPRLADIFPVSLDVNKCSFLLGVDPMPAINYRNEHSSGARLENLCSKRQVNYLEHTDRDFRAPLNVSLILMFPASPPTPTTAEAMQTCDHVRTTSKALVFKDLRFAVGVGYREKLLCSLYAIVMYLNIVDSNLNVDSLLSCLVCKNSRVRPVRNAITSQT